MSLVGRSRRATRSSIAARAASPICRLGCRSVVSATGWGAPEIRALFASHGLALHEWEKARTDRLTVREALA
jgi:hypothetical protein